jgi:hypothetical protein
MYIVFTFSWENSIWLLQGRKKNIEEEKELNNKTKWTLKIN